MPSLMIMNPFTLVLPRHFTTFLSQCKRLHVSFTEWRKCLKITQGMNLTCIWNVKFYSKWWPFKCAILWFSTRFRVLICIFYFNSLVFSKTNQHNYDKIIVLGVGLYSNSTGRPKQQIAVEVSDWTFSFLNKLFP